MINSSPGMGTGRSPPARSATWSCFTPTRAIVRVRHGSGISACRPSGRGCRTRSHSGPHLSAQRTMLRSGQGPRRRGEPVGARHADVVSAQHLSGYHDSSFTHMTYGQGQDRLFAYHYRGRWSDLGSLVGKQPRYTIAVKITPPQNELCSASPRGPVCLPSMVPLYLSLTV